MLPIALKCINVMPFFCSYRNKFVFVVQIPIAGSCFVDGNISAAAVHLAIAILIRLNYMLVMK